MDRKTLSVLLALGFFVVLGISLWQLFVSNTSEQSGLEAGQPMPEFAAPLAGSGLDADANVVQLAASGGQRAACRVQIDGAFNSCDHERLAVMFWLRRGGQCQDAVDVLSRLASEYPRVKVAAVAVGESVESATRIKRERGWQIDVPVDRDRAAALLYRVIGCPTLVTAYRGRIEAVELGRLSEREIRRALAGVSAVRGGVSAPTGETAATGADG